VIASAFLAITGVGFTIGAVVGGFTLVNSLIALAVSTCFTKDSKVSMADGTLKPISEIKVGDLVFNKDKTSVNQVTYVEKTDDFKFEQLYSVTKDETPFATVNHPLYINGKLSSVYPEQVYDIYPWLGKTSQLLPDRVVPATGQTVYNLWTTGDGSFIVNGYGTTTIMGDGGWGRLLVEQGIDTPERLTEVLQEFAKLGKETSYGAYVCNKIFGKLNIKFINKFAGKILASRQETRSRKAIKSVFKIVGKLAVYVAERKMKG
jgi:hypothetical protein